MILKEDWARYTDDPTKRLEMPLTTMFLIGDFSGGLRGEELPKMELGAIQKYWSEALEHPNTPHVPLVLSGRFKQTDGEWLYFLPLACHSQAGIEICLWAYRLLQTYRVLGVVSGPVFRFAHKGAKIMRSLVGDLDVLFHGVLARVQERWPRVLPPTVKVQDEISVRWSLW